MSASGYLRFKFQSDRQLAIHLDNGVSGTMRAAKGVASDIYSGLERASWYSSCFIPQYSDVCQELKAEEIRSLYSIESIFRYHDVVAHMLYLYFKVVCGDIEEGNENGSARKLIANVTGLAAHMKVSGATRNAFAEAASVALAQSNFMSKIVAERVSSKMPQAVFAIQFYGIQQKSALAARHLKVMEPKYYWILYEEKLEMLYYFVEPILSEMIKKVKYKFISNLDELSEFMKEHYGV